MTTSTISKALSMGAVLLGSIVSGQDEGVTSIDCDAFAFPIEGFTQNDQTKVYQTVDAVRSGVFKDLGLTKYATAFGVRTMGHKTTTDDQILHVNNIVAQVLDRDNDGKVDLEKVQQQLVERYSTLIIVPDDSFTNHLLSEDEAEGFPVELKMCQFSLDYEEANRIQPDGQPEGVCPDDLLEKDRSVAFVTDHIVGRAFPLLFQNDDGELGASPEAKTIKTAYETAVSNKTFDPSKTNCPANDAANCNHSMFLSWLVSSSLGLDRCYCTEVSASKLCDRAAIESAFPDVLAIIDNAVGKTPITGVYAPTDVSVLVEGNVDEL